MIYKLDNRFQRVLYVAGPYRHYSTHKQFENILRARKIAKHLWNLGFTVICPHTNSMLMDDNAASDELFLAGGLELLKRCDAIVMLPLWELSPGSMTEKSIAEDHDIPVFYWDDPVSQDALIEWSNKCQPSKSQTSKSEKTAYAKASNDSTNWPLLLGSTVCSILLWSIGTHLLLSRENDD